MYRASKLNKRADALSRRDEEVAVIEEAMHYQRTQTMIPRSRIDQAIIKDLLLELVFAPIEPEEPELEPYDSI